MVTSESTGSLMKRNIKFFVAVSAALLICVTSAEVNAQSSSRNAFQPAPQGSGSRSAPAFGAPGQFNQAAPNQIPNGAQQQQTPIRGSGLIGAQKEGCNCFQLPEFDPNPPAPYDKYASKNYWDLCPPTTPDTSRTQNCNQPRIDFNRFIPRVNGGLFGR